MDIPSLVTSFASTTNLCQIKNLIANLTCMYISSSFMQIANNSLSPNQAINLWKGWYLFGYIRVCD